WLADADRGPVEERLRKLKDSGLEERPPRLLPGSYFGRGVEDKVLLLRDGGGTMRSEEAVERGLEWLAAHQSSSGAWSLDGFHLAGKCTCSEPGQKFDIAATGLALLPFLGAGEVQPKSKYRMVVLKGLQFLIGKQKQEGNFSDNMYENALATTALCEAYGLMKDRDARLKGPAQAAVNYILKAQNAEGGWGYSPGAKGDTSVTGWQFSALKAAYYANLVTPAARFNRVPKFLEKVADPNGLGYGYNTPAAPPRTSATAVLC